MSNIFFIEKMTRFTHIFVLVILLFGSAFADSVKKIAEPTSLAVLVYYEPNSRDFADTLQPLLEAEASMQWTGRLVERMELNKLLKELKISMSGLIESSEIDLKSRLQLGRMIQADCLLSVKVASNFVKTTLSLFPSTSVIYERTYHERFQPHSMAINIVTDALKVFREYNRDLYRPQVSIGSFYCADPHRRFFDFSSDISKQLRQQLVQSQNIILTERLFPLDLLSEFELARSGFTEQVARCVSAPASDILLYGEIRPRSEQKLQSKAAVIDCTLYVLSPTALCKNLQQKFSCLSSDSDSIIRWALKLIEQAATEVRMHLKAGEKRSFSSQEFEAFKKQAFRLMRSPPLEDGNFYRRGSYRGAIQHASSEELKRALHLLESAMLFKGDDTQVLVCTGAVLEGLHRANKNKYSRDYSLLNASLDLIERAYYLDSNWNTRGMYWRFCLHGGLVAAERRPSRCLKAAHQIWNSRHAEPWHAHEIRSAFSILFESQTDLQQQCKMFLEAAPEYETEKNGLRDYFILFNVFIRQIYKCDGNIKVLRENRQFAEQLLAKKSVLLRSIGHLFHLAIYIEMGKAKNGPGIPVEFAEHFRAANDMLPELYGLYGKEFIGCSYSSWLCGFFRTYEKVLQKYGLKDDIVERKVQYITAQMKAGNYNSAGIVRLLHTLLPKMWEYQRYDQAYNLITEFLKHYVVGGSADYDRMWLARERNRFAFAIHGKSPLDINQLDKIEFDDGRTGWVTKVTSAGNRIFGIRSGQSFSKGVAFRLASGAPQANILREITGDVRDLACTDKLLGIANRLNGFYLLDNRSLETRHFTPQNSGLPGPNVSLVCDSGRNFYIGVSDKENLHTLIYHLEPDAAKISRTDIKFVTHSYWRMKSNILGTGQNPVVPQTWFQRTTFTDDKILEFSCSKNYTAVKEVTVHDVEKGQLLSYQGFELSYVFDFVFWKGQLIFATGNGLYTSKTGSNVIQCILSEPDLLVFSLCPLNDQMYVGTSNGLYCLKADHFIEL